MATTELTQSTPTGAGEKLRQLVGAGFARLVDLWDAARNRRSVARLLEWDDHMLRDIGLTTGDVRSALAAPTGHDPSSHLHAMALERRMASRAAGAERLERQSYFLRAITKQASPRPSSDERSDRQSA